MKEWSNARGRMEAEIARKKEHVNAATNFEKARGWVRSNWKTKHHQPGKETPKTFLEISSSSDEEKDKVDESSPDLRTTQQLSGLKGHNVLSSSMKF